MVARLVIHLSVQLEWQAAEASRFPLDDLRHTTGSDLHLAPHVDDLFEGRMDP